MITWLQQNLGPLLELSEQNISLFAMILRALLTYFFGILVLNYVNKRFLGERTPFDIILRFIIGSALANAITGSSPYWSTLGMVMFIVLLNWLLSLMSFYHRPLEKLLKGNAVTLYKDGEFRWKVMRSYHFTQDDILSEIRSAGLFTLHEIEQIVLEGNGEIHVIPKRNCTVHKKAHIQDDD